MTRKNSKFDKENLQAIIAYYNEDIDDKIISEYHQFKDYLSLSSATENLKCPEILQIIYEKNLIDIFPNLTTILKIFITLPITSCEAERNFSKLSIIKNKYRSTMLESRLNDLSILSIENDITQSLDYDETIKEYATIKCRKKHIV